MPRSETEMMLKGYGLTTAEFFYHMPDYAHVLNSYIWQEYDIAPDHPRLFKFVEFWQAELEGPLHSVRFTHRKMISPGEWQNQVGEFTLHSSNGQGRQAEQLAPPSTQNLAQWGWFRATSRSASAKVVPSSNSGS